MNRDQGSPSTELTPQGGLEEGGIHGLLGYQLAQAAILTTEAFARVVGKPLDLRPVEFTILQLVDENAPVTATKLAKALAVTAPGVTIWLDVQFEVLQKRVEAASHRPLARDPEKFRQLYDTRLPLYEKSEYRIVVQGDDSRNALEQILELPLFHV